MRLITYLIWFVKSDVELQTKTYHEQGRPYIDGFYFYSKRPFSKSYQYHGTLGLENTYNILALIEYTIKDKKKKAVSIQIQFGIGTERIYLWKGSLNKAKHLLFEMIAEIQQQY